MTVEWRRSVLSAEGLTDWKLSVAADPYCWLESKTIQLPEDASPSLFLHEVAHALHPYPEPFGEGKHYHGGGWAMVYGRLIDTYMTVRLTVRISMLSLNNHGIGKEPIQCP